MAIFLNDQEIRSLKLTAENPATEVEGHVLKTLEAAAKYGLVEYTEYSHVKANGKWWKQRQVIITQRGKDFLKEKDLTPTAGRRE